MKTPLSLLLASAISVADASSGNISAALAAETARAEALRQNDPTALSAVLSEDLRYVHSTGKLESKSDAVNAIASGATVYERFESSNIHAREIAPDVVVLTGSIDQRKRSGGKSSGVKLLFQAVWRRESGHWRLVAMQTALPPDPKP